VSLGPGPVLAPVGGGLGTSVEVSPAVTGIQIAQGDPGALLGSSSQLAHLGEQLQMHSYTVTGTAGSLATSWSGEAAGSYQQLSSIVSGHFRAAAQTSRTAAAALKRYSSELDRCQREGMAAVAQAEACLKEIKTETTRLHDAQKAQTDAQGDLSSARAEGTTARAAGPLGAPLAAVADAQASAAQGALTAAQSDIQRASRALAHAQEELKMWQARGLRAWEDAQNAADQATGSLQALTVVPPPLAGVAALPRLSPTSPVPLPGSPPGSSGEAGLTAIPLIGSLILPSKKKGRGGPGKAPTGPKRSRKHRRPEGDAPSGPGKRP
jgi:hypothetical protein